MMSFNITHIIVDEKLEFEKKNRKHVLNQNVTLTFWAVLDFDMMQHQEVTIICLL